MRCALDATFNELVAAAPVATGELARSGRVSGIDRRGESLVASISFPVEQATFTDEGTRPHRISVRTAKVLTDGVSFFGKAVNHPGSTKHVGWFTDTAEDAWPRHLEACK